MLLWSAIFFVVALIAGAMGFGGISSAMTETAQVLFFVFLVGFVITLVAGLVGSRGPRNAITGF